MSALPDTGELKGKDGTRRDFHYLLAGAMGAVSTAAAVWPLIDSMNPAADVRAISIIEVDLASIQLGQRITVVRQGNPVFIDYRRSEQVALAKTDNDDSDLIVSVPENLVMPRKNR